MRLNIGNLSFGCAPNDKIFQYTCICLKVQLSSFLFKGFFYRIMLYSNPLPLGLNLFNIYIRLSVCIFHTKGVVSHIYLTTLSLQSNAKYKPTDFSYSCQLLKLQLKIISENIQDCLNCSNRHFLLYKKNVKKSIRHVFITISNNG